MLLVQVKTHTSHSGLLCLPKTININVYVGIDGIDRGMILFLVLPSAAYNSLVLFVALQHGCSAEVDLLPMEI